MRDVRSIQRVSATTSEPNMPEWKAIETAPMDGTWIKVRGWDFGIEGSRRHYATAFYKGSGWLEVGRSGNRLRYLTDWQELAQHHNNLLATPSRSSGLIL
jgi:hypothetical protein